MKVGIVNDASDDDVLRRLQTLKNLDAMTIHSIHPAHKAPDVCWNHLYMMANTAKHSLKGRRNCYNSATLQRQLLLIMDSTLYIPAKMAYNFLLSLVC